MPIQLVYALCTNARGKNEHPSLAATVASWRFAKENNAVLVEIESRNQLDRVFLVQASFKDLSGRLQTPPGRLLVYMQSRHS
jgi:hypothetical protein